MAMRWVVVSDDLLPCPGGVAVWTGAVVEGLRQAGHEVQVFGRWRAGLAPDVVGVRQRSFARWGYLGLTVAARHAVTRADAVLARAARTPAARRVLKVRFMFFRGDVGKEKPERSARSGWTPREEGVKPVGDSRETSLRPVQGTISSDVAVLV